MTLADLNLTEILERAQAAKARHERATFIGEKEQLASDVEALVGLVKELQARLGQYEAQGGSAGEEMNTKDTFYEPDYPLRWKVCSRKVTAVSYFGGPLTEVEQEYRVLQHWTDGLGWVDVPEVRGGG